MPGYTPNLNLAYFDFGDKLDSVINAKLEADRFITIDRQLYGLYSIFGNGIISGLEVYDNGYTLDKGISIGVSSGMAVIKYMAAETLIPIIVTSLVPNSFLYIYASTNSASVTDRSINISYSTTASSGTNLVLIATVTTGESSISAIDNTVRTYIEYKQSIVDVVNDHKHRGSPTKVDLERETKNQLPGAKIEGFDASKIITGRLDSERVPVLNHSDLENAGSMTHSQIDAIINGISDQNLGLLGNVASVNLLRQIIFLKYKYTDVDKFMVNELTILPGVTPSRYMDTDASTAWIAEDTEWCIIGFPSFSRDTYFYTQNFELPSRPKKIILTSHKSQPIDSEIIFGVNTTNSVSWDDYTEISDGYVSEISSAGTNIRIGIKFVWNGVLPAIFSDTVTDFTDYVNLYFTNSGTSQAFHFRMRFYRYNFGGVPTDLMFTADSRIDQERWLINDTGFTVTESIPCAGYVVDSAEEVVVSFFPDTSLFLYHQTYYVVVDVWDGDSFEFESDVNTFNVSVGSNVGPCELYDYLPLVKNFAAMFEMDNGEQITLNLIDQ